jgi:hypothetical protein
MYIIKNMDWIMYPYYKESYTFTWVLEQAREFESYEAADSYLKHIEYYYSEYRFKVIDKNIPLRKVKLQKLKAI